MATEKPKKENKRKKTNLYSFLNLKAIYKGKEKKREGKGKKTNDYP